MKHKNLIALLLAGAMVLGLAACGGNSEPSPAGSSGGASSAGQAAASQSSAPSEDAGTTGGQLVVYSPATEGQINAVIPLFEEKYGIDVEVITGGTGELRILLR